MSRIDEVRGWLDNPEWPLFGPGIGRGPGDPGRVSARMAVEQVLDVLEDSLDAAWPDAEAALPEGMTFSLTRAIRPASEREAPTYYATASRPWTKRSIEFQVSAPTPAAALRALAERLRGER